MQLTDESLAEWRAHPVTGYVLAGLDYWLSEQEAACKHAAWMGSPWSEDVRRAVHMVGQFWGELKRENAAGLIERMEPPKED
jgi:hypothetical protein